jgi:hypothetical protein
MDNLLFMTVNSPDFSWFLFHQKCQNRILELTSDPKLNRIQNTVPWTKTTNSRTVHTRVEKSYQENRRFKEQPVDLTFLGCDPVHSCAGGHRPRHTMHSSLHQQQRIILGMYRIGR